MKLNSIISKFLSTTLIIIGGILVAETQQKSAAFVPAKPTKTTEKSSIAIGSQREQKAPEKQEKAATETTDTDTDTETTKKKSKAQTALKAVKGAAPEVIKQAPALYQSIKTFATGSSASTTAPKQETEVSSKPQPKKQSNLMGYSQDDDEEPEEGLETE